MNEKRIRELLRQRDELTRQIFDLKNPVVRVGCAKYDLQVFPTNLPDRHYIAVKVDSFDALTEPNRSSRFVTISQSQDKRKAIEAIPKIVADLQGLYERLNKKETDA